MERLLNGNFAETQTLLLSAIQLSCIPPFDSAVNITTLVIIQFKINLFE